MTGDPYRPEIERRLDALFDRVLRMSDAELRLLRMSWEEGDSDLRGVAWTSATAIVEGRGRADMLEDARSTLMRWVNSYLSATAIEYGTFLTNPGSGMDTSHVRREAIPPILDAVVALLAGDRLERQDADVLLEPVNRLASRIAGA